MAPHLPAYFETYGRKEPTGPNHIPYSYSVGKPEKAYFELVHEDPARMKVFMNAMSVSQRRVPTIGMYEMDWVIEKAKQEPERLIWVDVGGGKGHTVKQFVDADPGVPVKQWSVQDCPRVGEGA